MVDTTPTTARPADRLPVFQTCGASFRTFGRAPIQFLGLSLAAAVPNILYLTLFQPRSTGFTSAAAILTGVNLLVLYFLQIPMTYLAARILEGQTASMGEAFSVALRRYLPMLGATIVSFLLIYVGLILLIVPGLILACMYAVVQPVCILEERGPIESMKRSAALTKYNRWRILGIYILFFLPLIILSGGVTVLLTMQGDPLSGLWINQVIQLVWVPVAAVFAAAVYVGLRRTKETVGVVSVFD